MRVEVEGLASFVNRLEKFDKDVSKELKSRMRSAATAVTVEAKSMVPSRPVSNWGAWTYAKDGRDLSFDAGRVRRGYKVETVRTRARGMTIGFGYRAVQSSAAGMILEQIGSPGGGYATNPQFVSAVVRKVGPRPAVRGGKRFLVPAYYRVMPKVVQQMEAAINDAKRKVGL